MEKVRGWLHLVAIVASSIAASLAALSTGGDPLVGAAIGATANTVAAAVGEVRFS